MQVQTSCELGKFSCRDHNLIHILGLHFLLSLIEDWFVCHGIGVKFYTYRLSQRQQAADMT